MIKLFKSNFISRMDHLILLYDHDNNNGFKVLEFVEIF